MNLALERLIGAEQELLAGLAPRVKGSRNLGAAKGSVIKVAAILAGEWHTLSDALVDDVQADLGQAIHVGLAGPEVSAFDGVIEEPEDAVAVVAIVLCGIDAALGRDAMCAARAVLKTKTLDVIPKLAQRRSSGGASQPAADYNYVVLALVGRIHELELEPAFFPTILYWTGWQL